jgi:hypothetical protein
VEYTAWMQYSLKCELVLEASFDIHTHVNLPPKNSAGKGYKLPQMNFALN